MPKEATKMRRTIIAVFWVAVLQIVVGSMAAISLGSQGLALATRVEGSQPDRLAVQVVDRQPLEAATETTVPVVKAPAVTAPAVKSPTVPVARTVSAAARSGQAGTASWYSWQPGGCASRTVPKGVRITVTNASSGATATCLVDDYGPAEWTNRIIDLDETVFARIASTDEGVVAVRISW